MLKFSHIQVSENIDTPSPLHKEGLGICCGVGGEVVKPKKSINVWSFIGISRGLKGLRTRSLQREGYGYFPKLHNLTYRGIWISRTLDFWNLPIAQSKSHFPQSNSIILSRFPELPNFYTSFCFPWKCEHNIVTIIGFSKTFEC